jgi:hypothetical protein
MDSTRLFPFRQARPDYPEGYEPDPTLVESPGLMPPDGKLSGLPSGDWPLGYHYITSAASFQYLL